jgi:hypothetical protein
VRQLTLIRTENTEDGVFGQLYLLPGSSDTADFHTVEEDWRGNQRRVSCIPAGVYTIRRAIYHKHDYPTFEVMNVPGRTRILFHPANTEEDVEGCIGLGLTRGHLEVPDEDRGEYLIVQKRAVLQSRQGFRRFMFLMEGLDKAELTVKWADGVAH